MSGGHDHDHHHDHEHPTGPPPSGNEVVTLLGSLERQRRTLAWKCGDLDADGMRATVGVSTVTLGGLLKHLALVEDFTFATKFLGRGPGHPWESVDWDADPDWDWHSAAEDTPDELRALWHDAVHRSRAILEAALQQGGLDQPGKVTDDDGDHDGEALSLRRLLVDLIEEYARHVGHADLVRESVDGLVGEDPPD